MTAKPVIDAKREFFKWLDDRLPAIHFHMPTRERAIQDAVDAAAEILGWQPIETAPKDGTWIVVVGPLHGDNPLFRDMPRACVSRFFTEDDRYESPSCCPGWCYSAPGYSNLIEPTHWIPLPAPPSGVSEPESRKGVAT